MSDYSYPISIQYEQRHRGVSDGVTKQILPVVLFTIYLLTFCNREKRCR